MICAACGADLGHPERVGRRDVCPRCEAELHACRQCRFHDAAVIDGCREPQAERVRDKARANFCDYFAIEATAAPTAAAPSSTAAARAALDRLFTRR